LCSVVSAVELVGLPLRHLHVDRRALVDVDAACGLRGFQARARGRALQALVAGARDAGPDRIVGVLLGDGRVVGLATWAE
jgi:hypothetical protein